MGHSIFEYYYSSRQAGGKNKKKRTKLVLIAVRST